MTDDMIRKLMQAGLTKQQASSVTADTIIRLLMPEDGKTLIQEAKGQVEEMRQLLNSMRRDYYELVQKMKEVSDTITAVVEAQGKYGIVDDEKAKNVIALYGALLEMNEKAGAPGSDSVRNTGYVLYAYLGGQAKRDVNYSPDPDRG